MEKNNKKKGATVARKNKNAGQPNRVAQAYRHAERRAHKTAYRPVTASTSTEKNQDTPEDGVAR